MHKQNHEAATHPDDTIIAWMDIDKGRCTSAVNKRWMETCGFGVWDQVATQYTKPLYGRPQAQTSASAALQDLVDDLRVYTLPTAEDGSTVVQVFAAALKQADDALAALSAAIDAHPVARDELTDEQIIELTSDIYLSDHTGARGSQSYDIAIARAVLAATQPAAAPAAPSKRELEMEAARIAYASEFPLNADGEPDVGNIHANIRALKADLRAALAARKPAAPIGYITEASLSELHSRANDNPLSLWPSLKSRFNPTIPVYLAAPSIPEGKPAAPSDRYQVLQEVHSKIRLRRGEQSPDLRDGMNKALNTVERMMLATQAAPSIPAQAGVPDSVSLNAFIGADTKEWHIVIKHPFGATWARMGNDRDIKLAQLIAAAPSAPAAPVTNWEQVAKAQDAKLRAMCGEPGGMDRLREVLAEAKAAPSTPAQAERVHSLECAIADLRRECKELRAVLVSAAPPAVAGVPDRFWDIEVTPREPFDDEQSDGMLESDDDFIRHNIAAAVALLEMRIAATPSAPVAPVQDLSASGLLTLWNQAEAMATDAMPAPFQFARLLLAAQVQPVAVPEDAPPVAWAVYAPNGNLRIWFSDFESAQVWADANGLDKTKLRPLVLGDGATQPVAVQEGLTAAARDVLAERRRQVEQEGWTTAHDDQYTDGQMPRAAACYAAINTYPTPSMWPWAPEWWKPRDFRSNYVRAAALLVAEIERIDRAAATQPADGKDGA